MARIHRKACQGGESSIELWKHAESSSGRQHICGETL